jgi:hypothetical protein
MAIAGSGLSGMVAGVTFTIFCFIICKKQRFKHETRDQGRISTY